MAKQQIASDVSNERSDKTAASRPDERELLQSIGTYLSSLGAVQERLFGLIDGEGDEAGPHATTYKNFYDFSKLDGHTALFKGVTSCFERSEFPSVLTIFEQWSRCRLDDSAKPPASLAVVKKQLSCAKLVAGLCFLHGNYYEALQCLLHVVRIDRCDSHCWYLLLRWLLWLDEWEAVATMLAEEKRVIARIDGAAASKNDGGYATMIAIITLLHRLQTLPEGVSPSRTIAALLEKLECVNAKRNERMTYALCHSKAMIKEAMVLASRFPKADLEKIGDPLQNRSEQVEICDAVLRNRFPPFFNSQASRAVLQRKAVDPDEFLKICASVADYCEASSALAGEYLDTGLTREVEAHTVAGIKHSLLLGIPYRVIQPAAFLLFEKSVLTLEQEQFPAYVSMVNSFFTLGSHVQCAWLQKVERRLTLAEFKRELDKASTSLNDTRSELMERVFATPDDRSAAPPAIVMPSQLAGLWMRTSLAHLLKYPGTEQEVSDEDAIKSLLKICERNTPKWCGEWLLLRTLGLSTTSRDDVIWAYQRMKDYGHLFYREWRNRNSALLATGIDEVWHKAMYWVEAATPCIRQHSRLVNYKKGDLSGSYYFDSSVLFKEAVQRLPEDFTLINLALDQDGSLVISKLHRKHEPLVMKIGKRTMGRDIVEKATRLLAESEKSVTDNTNDAEKFWRVRRRLDNEMKLLLWEMQNKWLGQHSSLLVPYRNKSDHSGHSAYVLLVVPPQLSFLPWECMPLYDETLVTRVPSFHFFDNLLSEAESIPKMVDARKSYYVLNPGGDLAKSQERLTTFIDKFNWPGLVGQVPTRDQVQKALQLNDLFLYMGHGSGGRYFGRSSIRESRCKAVSILMGCCSARIVDEGPGFDGRASLYEYLIAKCPCVVGCLWTVTDGDIDRFFMALVDACFSQFAAVVAEVSRGRDGIESTPTTTIATRSSKAKKAAIEQPAAETKIDKVEVCQILLQGIVKARKACKLPYLTGASITSYGLPVSSLLLSAAATPIIKREADEAP